MVIFRIEMGQELKLFDDDGAAHSAQYRSHVTANYSQDETVTVIECANSMKYFQKSLFYSL